VIGLAFERTGLDEYGSVNISDHHLLVWQDNET